MFYKYIFSLVIFLSISGCTNEKLDEKSIRLANLGDLHIVTVRALNNGLVEQGRPPLLEENIYPEILDIIAKNIAEDFSEYEKDDLIRLFESDAYKYVVGVTDGTTERTRELDEKYLPVLKDLNMSYYNAKWYDFAETLRTEIEASLILKYTVQVVHDEFKD